MHWVISLNRPPTPIPLWPALDLELCLVGWQLGLGVGLGSWPLSQDACFGS